MYTVTVRAELGFNSIYKENKVTIKVQISCENAALTIDPTILTSDIISYDLRDSMKTVTLGSNKVSTTATLPACPTNYAIGVVMQDGHPKDVDVFTYRKATTTLSM